MSRTEFNGSSVQEILSSLLYKIYKAHIVTYQTSADVLELLLPGNFRNHNHNVSEVQRVQDKSIDLFWKKCY